MLFPVGVLIDVLRHLIGLLISIEVFDEVGSGHGFKLMMADAASAFAPTAPITATRGPMF